MTTELVELLREVSRAVAYLDNCMYKDRHRARHELEGAARDLADYYESELYDGPEE